MTLIQIATIIRNGMIDATLIVMLAGCAVAATVLLWFCEDKAKD